MGGVVTFADWNYYLGWMVVIENNGVQVILGHMCCGTSGKTDTPTDRRSLQVSAGEVISAGTIVGRTGNTGNSFGVHLHFEVRVCDTDGKCQIVNPSSVYLPGQESYCDWEGFKPHKR
jgi:murein DD-endopeptidase MepM/ murein hydrolase activator NlpD